MKTTPTYLAEYPELHGFLSAYRRMRSAVDSANADLAMALETRSTCPPSVEIDMAAAECLLKSDMAPEAYKLLRPYLESSSFSRNPSEVHVANQADLALPYLARSAAKVSQDTLDDFIAGTRVAYSGGVVGDRGILNAALELKESGLALEALSLASLVMEKSESRAETADALRLSLCIHLDLGQLDCARALIAGASSKSLAGVNPIGILTDHLESPDGVFGAVLAYVLGRREEAVSRATACLSEQGQDTRFLEDLACLAGDAGDHEVFDWCVEQVLDAGLPLQNAEFLFRVAKRLADCGDIEQAVETYGLVIETGKLVSEARLNLEDLVRRVEHAETLRECASPEPPDRLFKARRYAKRGEHSLACEEYLLYLQLEANRDERWRKEAEDGLSRCKEELKRAGKHGRPIGKTPATEKATVLIAAPVRQEPAVLREFLRGLKELSLKGHGPELQPDFLFVDDNTEEESRDLLYGFRPSSGRVYIAPYASRRGASLEYERSNVTHRWNNDLMDKVGALKDFAIEFALSSGYDYVFLVDSDLVLHPNTLDHLLWTDRDVVSEVFWTKWRPDSPALPQVWLGDQYRLHDLSPGESLDTQEAQRRVARFVNQLKTPGIYRVGGLGACTLIKRECLEKGVRFCRIDNLTMVGEDRYFCVRARALGVELHADTMYPPFHIYRDSDLAQLKNQKPPESVRSLGIPALLPRRKPRLTLSMLVRNEAHRYLREVLENAALYVDEAVILDDASDDNTVEVCRDVMDGAGIPLILVSNKTPGFHNEVALRKQQWDLAVASGADWIICLDADEVFEKCAAVRMKALVEQDHSDVVCFRLFDMWDRDHYRDDKYWSAHHRYFPFMVRYRTQFQYHWKETPLHCGRLPANIALLPTYCSDLRIKHLGWADPSDRKQKYERYLSSDPEGKYGIIEQYRSILDPQPNLVRWRD